MNEFLVSLIYFFTSRLTILILGIAIGCFLGYKLRAFFSTYRLVNFLVYPAGISGLAGIAIIEMDNFSSTRLHILEQGVLLFGTMYLFIILTAMYFFLNLYIFLNKEKALSTPPDPTTTTTPEPPKPPTAEEKLAEILAKNRK